MLLDKMDQGTIKGEITDLIIESGEGLLNDDGVDETVAKELAETILEKVMSTIHTMGYFVVDGIKFDIAKHYGILPSEIPPEFLDEITRDIQNNLDGAVETAFTEARTIYPEGKLANLFRCTTTEHYWDCECKEDYIHSKSQIDCVKCNCAKEDMPDSMIREVVRHGLL